MRISVLQHAACEGPGEIGNWAVDHGHGIRVHHLYRGDSLPVLSSFDFLVVMGGDMNIYQDRDYPWLKPERALIHATLESGKRAIGICLGAQLIADALGGRVTQNPVHEIGWFPIQFTPEAHAIFPNLPAAATVLHWHGDTFALPVGATRLAASEGCPEQGYVVPGQCLGLQFHLEIDAELVRQTVEGSSDFSLWPKGIYVQPPKTILAQVPTYSAPNRAFLYGMLDTFFQP